MKFFLYTAIVFLFSFSCHAKEEASFSIGQTGEFHGDEVNFKNNELVYVLKKSGNQYVIEKDKLWVEYVEDAIVDAPGGKKTGKKLSLENNKNLSPEHLIMKHKSLEAGPVLTAEYDSDCFKIVNNSCSVKFANKIYILKINKKHEDREEPLYDIEIEHDSHVMSLEAVNEIIWLGDIDRDNNLDFIFDFTDHYNIWLNRSLYLSSYAHDGELAREAGYIQATGC